MSDIFRIVVGTAGHIDHGKSSLVQALTGIHPDRWKEEKERGLTIDLGFAPFSINEKQKVGIIDVPGHEKFVKNMVAGASSMDFVILVVAANDGIMPQTREHLEIIELLGIHKGIVALTKVDTVDEDLREIAEEEIVEFISETCLRGSSICPVSVVTGEGLEEFRKKLIAEISTLSPQQTEGIFRMPVQRAFSLHGHGTVVTGVPIGGEIQVGDSLEILPIAQTGKVKKIHSYGSEVDKAQSGHSCALNLTGIDFKKVRRGYVAGIPGYFSTGRFIDASFHYLSSQEFGLSSQTPIQFHSGTLEAMGKVVIIGQESVEPGDKCFIQVRLEEEVPVVVGDSFLLRIPSPAVTIGGGMVVGVGNKKHKPMRESTLSILEEESLATKDPKKRVVGLIEKQAALYLRENELERASLMTNKEFSEMLTQLQKDGQLISGPNGKWTTKQACISLKTRIEKELKKFFQQNFFRQLCPQSTMNSVQGIEAWLWSITTQELEAEDIIRCHKDTLELCSHQAFLAERDHSLANDILGAFEANLFSPPEPKSICSQFRLSKEKWQEIYLFLEDTKQIVSVEANIIFHQRAINEAWEKVSSWIKENGSVSSAQVRDLLETSRKFVIPMLEYFDRQGKTQRNGNERILG